MYELTGRKVKYALFHQTLHIKGVGELGKSLPRVNKTDVVEMLYDGANLHLIFNGGKIKASVPSANIVDLEYLE